jgi:hypothetical protein
MRILAFSRKILVAIVVAAAVENSAAAQWIGPGSTIAGDYLRGVGVAAAGMGIYNEKTAIAESINLDTAIRLNEYVAAVAKEMKRVYVERRRYLSAQNKEMNEKIADRITIIPNRAT